MDPFLTLPSLSCWYMTWDQWKLQITLLFNPCCVKVSAELSFALFVTVVLLVSPKIFIKTSPVFLFLLNSKTRGTSVNLYVFGLLRFSPSSRFHVPLHWYQSGAGQLRETRIFSSLEKEYGSGDLQVKKWLGV
ncbi:hypothetical protein MATL_G00105210 [Megalops atlanticus]|uniref:Uncharacterized protein n=1 Tax=Megalops atlanticus TaxID=7932 RepID=A0A9D3Q0U7_MEGAT|nr:hypothetical protein MATL_G00105210 [Megalops atlanticus]